jgi:hypothetical protein
MSFNGNEGAVVSLTDASRWTANYRKTINEGDIFALFAGKEKLLRILNQEDCMGIRFYFGIGDDGKPNLVAVGADANENDMEQGVIVENFFPCPYHCSTANPLHK